MDSLRTFARIRVLIFSAVLLLVAGSVQATNHCDTQIDEIMAGANGDSSIQFVEMSFGGCGQNMWGPNGGTATRSMLVFFDASGNQTGHFRFPSNPDCGNNKVLVATQAFASLSGAPTPEFIIPPLLSPRGGKVCFKGNFGFGPGQNSFAFNRNECLSYGPFTGNTETNAADFCSVDEGVAFGPPAPALGILNTTSLTRVSDTESNASFTLSSTPTPLNHLSQTFTIPVLTQVLQGQNLFTKETFGGNGRTCASCHEASTSFGLTPARIQTRFSTVSSTFDTLFIGETNFNLNTLVVSSPLSGDDPTTAALDNDTGPRDLTGVITGSGGGTAKVLTKLISPASPSTIKYLVYGGVSPALSGTISDTRGNSATFVSITAGGLTSLENPAKMRGPSTLPAEFPNGRGLILENIDGFANPHVFRKSPVVDNIALTSPFGLSGEFPDLGDFSGGAVRQHFPRSLNRVADVDFREATSAELDAMEAFQNTKFTPADQDFNLDKFATTTAQKAGRTVFFGSAKCSKCHSGTVLAQVDGTVPAKSGNARFNTGVVNLPINLPGNDNLPAEALGFREFSTPALFNVRNHAPFFHDASKATLHDAVEFYTTSSFTGSPAAIEIGGPAPINIQQINDMTAFLEGLTPRPYSLAGGPLSFGSQPLAAGPTGAQTITITNNSAAPITFTTPFAQITGMNASEFSISASTLGATLGASASATVSVTFDPATTGAKNAILELLAEIPSGVNLSGHGGPLPTQLVKVQPLSPPTVLVTMQVPVNPAVKVMDVTSTPVPDVPVTFTVTAGGGNITGPVNMITINTGGDGIATVPGWFMGTAAGTNTLIVTSPGLPSRIFNATAVVGQIVKVAPLTAQTATVGTFVPTAPVVQILDPSNNPVSGATVTFTIIAGGGTIGAASVVTDVNGLASVVSWKLGPLPGTHTFRASCTAAGTVTRSFNTTATAAQFLKFDPLTAQSGTVNTAAAVRPAVRLLDASNNPIQGLTVNFSVTAGGGSVGGASQVTDSNGVARVGSWTYGTIVGTNTVLASSPSAGSTTRLFGATTTAGAAANQVKVEPLTRPSATVGTDAAVKPAVRVTDSFGNAVSGVAVNFAVTAGGGSITGGSQTSGSDGIARVGSWTLGTTAGVNTLTVTSSGLPTRIFNTDTVAGPATQMVKHSPIGPQTGPVNTPVAVNPSVLVMDQFNNPVAGVTVTFAVTAGGGSATGTTQLTGADGRATVGSFTLGPVAGANSITASSAGLPSRVFNWTGQ